MISIVFFFALFSPVNLNLISHLNGYRTYFSPHNISNFTKITLSCPEFQEEAESVIRFWMDTGLDGMVLDAVNWYVGCTWENVRRRMTNVVASYGNTYVQPEDARGIPRRSGSMDHRGWIQLRAGLSTDCLVGKGHKCHSQRHQIRRPHLYKQTQFLEAKPRSPR